MAEMVLNLKLMNLDRVEKALMVVSDAVLNMDKAFAKLNKTLKKLESTLAKLTDRINLMGELTLPKNPVGRPRKNPIEFDLGISGGANAGDVITNPFERLQAHINSILFSVAQGQWQIAFSKVLTSLRSLAITLGKAGPIGLAVAAIGAAVVGFAIGLRQLHGKIQEWASSIIKYSPAPQFMGVGAGLGSLSGFSNALWSSPGGPDFLDAQIKMLRGVKDDRSAYWMAKALPQGQELWAVRSWSDKTLDRAMNMSVNPETMKKAADATASVNIEMTILKNAVMEPLVDIFHALLPLIRGFISFLTFMAKIFSFFVKMFILFNFPINIARSIEKYFSSAERAADKQMKAADKFSEAVNDFVGGKRMIGGGVRSRNAIPASWIWGETQTRLINNAKDLGAFEL